MDLLEDEDIFNIIKHIGHTKVVNWSVKSYSDELLGYLGEHLTLSVEVETGAVQKFFVKCIPRLDEWKAKYITEHAFFEKEYAMLHSLFVKFGQGTQKWRPEVFLEKKNLFVFEDVVEQGYTMVRGRDTLTLEEVEACIATMGRFHAQSYIYEENKSVTLNRPYRIWEDYSDHLKESVRNNNWRRAGMNAAMDLLKAYSKFKTQLDFDKKIESAIPILFDEALALMKPHSTYRNVVVHRDLWMNNILFKNIPNGVYHALFVDFQTVLYCPPMLDFTSFLYFNTRRDFRDLNLNKLIDLYYSNLQHELKTVNLHIESIITRESMKKSYEESVKFGTLQAALIIPITLISKDMNKKLFCNPEKVKYFYDTSRSEEMLELAKTDERYRAHVIELLDEIVEKYIV